MTISEFNGKYRFLSNFYPSLVEYGGIKYCSVEHAYQAAKTEDKEAQLAISRLATPGAAKKAGRKLKMRPDWDKIKLQVMEDLLRIKFSDPTLAKKLNDTGNQILIEGNTWGDRFWGMCGGVGENHLGKLLMAVREDCYNAIQNQTLDPLRR